MSTIFTAGTATMGAIFTSDATGSLQFQTGSTPTTAATLDSSGNLLLGTTTGFTSTTYGGQFASGGVGIYPWVNSSSGTTNTTVYSGIVYQNPTVFSGTNGASNQNLYTIISAPQISSSGVGGALNVGAYGYYSVPNLISSTPPATFVLCGYYTNLSRYSATDTANGSFGMQGLNFQINHQATLASTAITSTVSAASCSITCNQATMSTVYAYRNSLGVATISSPSNTCVISNYYGCGVNSVGIGVASGMTGTVSNYYGVYLVNPTINATGTITNRYAIYSADTANSFFAGNIGIGTTTPAAPLHIVSTTTSASASAVIENAGTTATALLYFKNSAARQMLIGYTGATYAAGEYGVIDVLGAYPLVFSTNDTERMRLDSAGNLGLGVVPNTWSSGAKALQLPNGGSFSVTATSVHTNFNAYYNTGWKYISANTAANYYQQGNTHVWRISADVTPVIDGAINWTTAMTIDNYGTLGVGATPSAWITYKTIQAGSFGSFADSTTGNVDLANNRYGASGDRFIGTGYATMYRQVNDGSHKWFSSTASGTAGNGITFTQAMTLDGSGNLILGGTDTAVGKMVVKYTSDGTTPTSPAQAGLTLWGSSSVRLMFGTYTGSPYAAYIQTSNTGNPSVFPLALNPNGGNVGIGTASPTSTLSVTGTLSTTGVGTFGTTVGNVPAIIATSTGGN